MRLLTVGDSFTHGEELQDISMSWPNVLAKKIGYDLTNLARPGSGNTRMVRHAVEQVDNYDMIIIAWSHFARFELADEGGFYDLWPGCDSRTHKIYAPWREDAIKYTTHYHNDDYLYKQYLLNIILIQNYLKANNKRYFMLDSFGNHQANQRTELQNKHLLDQIDSAFYIGWPNESLMEWTYNTPQGPQGHFLNEGHIRIADKIYYHMEQLSWLS